MVMRDEGRVKGNEIKGDRGGSGTKGKRQNRKLNGMIDERDGYTVSVYIPLRHGLGVKQVYYAVRTRRTDESNKVMCTIEKRSTLLQRASSSLACKIFFNMQVSSS